MLWLHDDREQGYICTIFGLLNTSIVQPKKMSSFQAVIKIYNSVLMSDSLLCSLLNHVSLHHTLILLTFLSVMECFAPV